MQSREHCPMSSRHPVKPSSLPTIASKQCAIYLVTGVLSCEDQPDRHPPELGARASP